MTWLGRTRELHAEIAAIANVDPTWWLLAGAAAAIEALPARTDPVVSDAGPAADTFIGHRATDPEDPIADAIAAAHAARAAIRELDGQLPDQPLAVTVSRGPDGARTIPSALDVAAFAIGDSVLHARLADDIEDEVSLAMKIGDLVRDERARQRLREPSDVPAPTQLPAPFVCVSLGEDRITVARHGHRRAWRNGAGPWLGLGRVGGLITASTCHLVVDGYGHAWLAARISHLRSQLRSRCPGHEDHDLPHLALVPDTIPLGVAWRDLPQPAPRSLPLAYALGCVLHRLAGERTAPFSPTFQLPVAPGERGDASRLRRRVRATTLSVRFADGRPEPFEIFATRARSLIARDAAGGGLVTRLLGAARAVPLPLALKRRSLSAARPGWIERIAEVIGGRAYLSKITLSTPSPFACAVSSPARTASPRDLLGGCVITIIDDGDRAAITACGSGLAGEADTAADLIDALLRALPDERRTS